MAHVVDGMGDVVVLVVLVGLVVVLVVRSNDDTETPADKDFVTGEEGCLDRRFECDGVDKEEQLP